MAADVTLTVGDVARTGLNLTGAKTVVDAANTYYFANDGRTALFVDNVTGDTCVVTITVPTLMVDGLAVANRTVSIVTAKIYLIGPFPPNWYNNGSGQVKVTFDKAVEISAVRG
jgi:hypothetical protein